MTVCVVSWCVAAAGPGKQCCAIHERFGRDYRALDELARCDTCHGTRTCGYGHGDGAGCPNCGKPLEPKPKPEGSHVDG